MNYELKQKTAKNIIIIALLMCAMGSLQGAGDFYGNGDRSKKQIAITFDDGPGPATVEILDILDQYKVKAAFFMLGEQVKKRKKIAQEVYVRGHEVCNHTYKHTNLYKYKDTIPRKILDTDIKKGMNAIYQVTGVLPRYLRIPHGYYRKWVSKVAEENNVDVVHWTFGCDWKKIGKEEMIEKYLEAVKPGAILLFHDGGSKRRRKKTISILPLILKAIQAKGYTIEPLSDLLHPKE